MASFSEPRTVAETSNYQHTIHIYHSTCIACKNQDEVHEILRNTVEDMRGARRLLHKRNGFSMVWPRLAGLACSWFKCYACRFNEAALKQIRSMKRLGFNLIFPTPILR